LARVSASHLGLLRPMAKPLWHDMLAFAAREAGARSAA
jgi:hypothetical protein